MPAAKEEEAGDGVTQNKTETVVSPPVSKEETAGTGDEATQNNTETVVNALASKEDETGERDPTTLSDEEEAALLANALEGTIIPFGLTSGETIIDVEGPFETIRASMGTELSNLGLPTEVNITISTPPETEGGQATTRTEPATVTWVGDYDSNTYQRQMLTAQFTDASLSFTPMPTVSIELTETRDVGPKSASANPTSAAACAIYYRGDVNLDGKIDDTDMMKLIRMNVDGTEPPRDSLEYRLYDVNLDGEITISDYRDMWIYAAGNNSLLPYIVTAEVNAGYSLVSASTSDGVTITDIPATIGAETTDTSGNYLLKKVSDNSYWFYTKLDKAEFGKTTTVTFTLQQDTPTAGAAIASDVLNITKTLTGHILPLERTFEFTLSRTDGGAADAVTLPTNTKTTTAVMRNGSSKPVGFDAITFHAAGTYTFAITETNDGQYGVSYAPAQTVTVKVTDTNGVLSAAIVKNATDDTPASGALIFTNSYAPDPVVAAEPSVNKVVTGDPNPPAETFAFKLSAVSYTAPQGSTETMTAAQMPMPTGSASGTKAVTRQAAGSVNFGKTTFAKAGVYVYTVAETKGTNRLYSYDDSVYTLTYTVTDTAGKLGYALAISKAGGSSNPNQAVFTNTYTRSVGTLVVSKTVTNGGDTNGLFTFRFTFGEAARYNYVKSDNTTGTIATGGTLQLKHGESVTITIPQGVTYTVVEDAYQNYVPTPSNRTYSGTISQTQSMAAYTNRYDPSYNPPAPTLIGNLTVKKTVTGDLGDKNKDFAFTITFNAAGSYTYTGSKSGTITSGNTVLLRHGQYITIVNLPAGTTYSVTESGNTGYRVYTSGDTGAIAANGTSTAAFTNSKSKVPATGDDNAILKGALIMMVSLLGAGALIYVDRRIANKRRKQKTAR